MTKVLIMKFPYASSFGGGEQHTLTIVEGLRSQGIRFHLVSSCAVLLKEFAKRAWSSTRLWAGVEPVSKWSVVVFPLTAIPVLLVLLSSLIVYRTRGYRLLYCLSLTEKLLIPLLARVLGMRVVWMEHVGFDRWLSKNPFRLLFALNSRLATTVVPSEALSQEAQRLGVPKNRIRVIPHGIEAAAFAPPPDRPVHPHYTIGTVGRLEPEKGMEQLLIAFAQVRDVIPDARLVLVGDGTQRRKLVWLAKNLEIEHEAQFVGFQQPVARWYQTFDCFVLPSVRRESFGIVLLEALASEIPVVTSAIGGTTEIIRNGENGLTVPPRDPEKLAEAIATLYHQPEQAKHFATQGRVVVEEMFSKELMLKNWKQLISSHAG